MNGDLPDDVIDWWIYTDGPADWKERMERFKKSRVPKSDTCAAVVMGDVDE